MATSVASSVMISGLAHALVQHQLLSQKDAESMVAQARNAGNSFVEQFLLKRQMSALDLALFSSQQFGIPLLDIDAFNFERAAAAHFDAKFAAQNRLFPLHTRGKILYVAVSDPTNYKALDEMRFKSGMQVMPVLVEDDKLGRLLARKLEEHGVALEKAAASMEDLEVEFESAGDAKGQSAPAEESSEVENSPVVKYLQKILLDAISAGASDIHIEPYEKFFRVRFRIDGVLQEVAQPPLPLREPLASRIKVISRLDIAEKRVPQDGRMKLQLANNKVIDFRVSTLPTLYGEKVVLRILDSSGIKLGIDALGYEEDQQEQLLNAIKRPYGMILVTGPTGSGKTVSLYTCLNLLNQPGVNIATAEDPAEIQLPGVNQVNVNEKAGLTFASALRAFLRQDPDIVMVGEIRDFETADIAVKAAQTGHLVLSTLHTNDAPTTLVRLHDMGMPAFSIASSVIMITAQRLGRRLCPKCKKPIQLPRHVLIEAGFHESELDGTWTPYGPVGCPACKDSGYKGRVGIYEVMPISDAMRELIMNQGSALDIAAQAQKEGVRNLRQSGLLKVKSGVTSLEEIEAITNE
jgi:type IV pilus assembly protein PilB